MRQTYVIDGGPSTGKTTLLNALEARGHTIVPEAARPIIAEEMARAEADSNYTPVVPWTNFLAFQHRVMDKTASNLAQAQADTIFADRHFPSIIGYSRFAGVDVPEQVYAFIAENPITRVFIPEQLAYVNDSVRQESAQEARRIHECVVDAYIRIGADVVTVPHFNLGSMEADVTARADFVLENVVEIDEGMEVERKYRVDHQDIRARLTEMRSPLLKSGQEDTWVAPVNKNAYHRVRFTENKAVIGYKNRISPDEIEEQERTVPSVCANTHRAIIGANLLVRNYLEEYGIIGNPHAHVSLDNIEGLGEFVEIEAASSEQLDRLEALFGITAEPIRQSYWQLLKNVA